METIKFDSFNRYCQERAPWNINYTIVPIAIPIAILLGKMMYLARGSNHSVFDVLHWYTRKSPHWLFNKHFNIGMFFMTVAMFFFVRGLDDENDYLRYNHGLWHLFVGFAFYFLFNAPDVTTNLKQTRHIYWKKSVLPIT